MAKKVSKKAAKKKTARQGRKVSDLKMPENYSISKTGITQSLIKTWLFCPLAFLYVVNLFRPKKPKSPALTWGSLVHDVLEKIYNRHRIGKKITDYMINKWIDAYELEGRSMSESEFDKAKASVILTEYVRYYPEDFTRRKWLALEPTMKVMYMGFKLMGKIDGKFSVKEKIWHLETKTKSIIDSDTLQLALSFDFQNLMYILMDEKKTGQKIQGVLYNVIRNPGHRQLAGESLKEYCQRLRAEIQKNPEHFFIRFEIAYTEKDKKNFQDELMKKLSIINSMTKGELRFFKNENSCVGGRFKCDYLEACSTGVIGNNYRKEKELFPEL